MEEGAWLEEIALVVADTREAEKQLRERRLVPDDGDIERLREQ